MHIVTLFCILLPVLGALPFVIVLIKKKRIEAFKAKAVVTTATVLKAEKKMGFRGSTYYLLSLEYRKVNSNEVYQVKRVVYEPVELKQEFRNFDFLSPWEGTDYVLPGDEKKSQ